MVIANRKNNINREMYVKMRKKIIYWIGIIPFLLLFFCTSCSFGDKPNDAVIKEFESEMDYRFEDYKKYLVNSVSIEYKNVHLFYIVEYDIKDTSAVKLIYDFDISYYMELVEPKNSSFEVPITIKFTPSELNDKKSNEFSIERKLKIYEKKHYVDYYLNNTKTYKKDEVNNYKCENDIYKWNEVGNIYSSWYTSNSKIESNNTLNLNELLFTSNYIRTMEVVKNIFIKDVYYFNITYYVNTGIIEVKNRKKVFSSRTVHNEETYYKQYNIDLNKKDNMIHTDTEYILELLKRMDSFFYMYGLTDKVSPLYGTNYSTELIGTEKTDK